ncbi:hydrogenase expression/formation C-terminal domain-containing protein [Amphritea sp. HPY]|uniref:hydrogenase expression/formation protein n=1 Tax=Amphritea sp. HPY TaxID=3421652 RepID=UPI003D7DB16D
MHPNDIPLINMPAGPGSQAEAEDDMVLDYMPMPSQMNTYDLPIMPEAEELAACPETLLLLDTLQQGLDSYRIGQPTLSLELDKLSVSGLQLINQILGEGEVSLVCQSAGLPVNCQETVLAGVWRLRYLNGAGQVTRETLEIAEIPQLIREQGFAGSELLQVDRQQWPVGVLNAPPVLVELQHKSYGYQAGSEPHVINLSLLPFSPSDHELLEQNLGQGAIVILSRGYGNCRISSTRIKPVWRVQYFNSTDQLILDTLEVVDIPAVACAAQEDLQDSAERLKEIREVLV